MTYQITLHQIDAMKLLRSLPDNSVAAVVTDPPYGIEVKGWDMKVDSLEFLSEAARVSQNFVVFFGQFPSFAPWLFSCEKLGLHPMEHISWVKRKVNFINKKRLGRSHEDIFLYACGTRKTFHSVRGMYSDVKVPGLQFDCVSLEGIKRRIGRLEEWIRDGEPPFDSSGRRQSINTAASKLNHRATLKLDTNFSNVWCFLPPAFATGRAGKKCWYHPCEKPVAVLQRILQMVALPGETVVDPFMGSGTTAIAAMELGVDFIGSELNSDYLITARSRIDGARKCGELTGSLRIPIPNNGKLSPIPGNRQLSLILDE